MDEKQAKALRAAFPASAIGKLPRGGVQLDYVGHAATTDRLLSVDPEWTWEPMATDTAGLPILDNGGNLWIRLTVCGVTRIGVGDGKSAKECIGDAIRNAAMRFGVALDLWAKEDLHEISQHQAEAPPAAPPSDDPWAATLRRADEEADDGITPAQVKKLGAAMTALGMTNRDEALGYVAAVIGREVGSRNELSKAEASRVIDALEKEGVPA